jgi:hypothetical protein
LDATLKCNCTQWTELRTSSAWNLGLKGI